MKFRSWINLFIAAILVASPIAKAEIAVIVHPSNTSAIDEKFISQIFLGKKKSFPSGENATALNLSYGSPVREEFNQTALNKSSSQIKAYWAKIMFTGKGQPPKEASPSEVKNIVATDTSAIGYIDASFVDDTVKVVTTF